MAGEILPALREVPRGIVLNVNIPGAPRHRIRGIRQARLAAAGAVQLSIGEATTGYLHVATDQTGEHAGCRRGDRSRISPAKCGQPDGLRLAKPALPP